MASVDNTTMGFTCPPAAPGIAPGPPSSYVWFATIFSPIYIVGGLALFIYARPYSIYLRKRWLFLQGMMFVSGFITWAYAPLFDLLGPSAFPCWLLGLLYYFSMPLFTASFILKDVLYLVEVAAIRLGKKTALEKRKDSVHSVNVDVDDFDIVRADGSFTNFLSHLKWGMLGIRSNPEDRVKNVKFSRSKAMVAFWLSMNCFPFILAWIVRMATNPVWNQNCFGCRLSTVDAIIGVAYAIGGSTVGNAFHIRRVSKMDALGITWETKISWRVTYLASVAMALYLWDPNGIYTPQNLFNWLEILLWVALILWYISTYHQVYRARRDAKKILMISHLDREEKYRDVMRNRESRNAFKTHLDMELSSEIYLFMDAVELYRGLVNDKETRSVKAAKIMDSFIRPYGPFEINLNASLRERQEVAYEHAIAESKASANGLPLNLFDNVYEDVKKHLLSDGFLRFLQHWSQEPGTHVSSHHSRHASNSSNVVGPPSPSPSPVHQRTSSLGHFKEVGTGESIPPSPKLGSKEASRRQVVTFVENEAV